MTKLPGAIQTYVCASRIFTFGARTPAAVTAGAVAVEGGLAAATGPAVFAAGGGAVGDGEAAGGSEAAGGGEPGVAGDVCPVAVCPADPFGACNCGADGAG